MTTICKPNWQDMSDFEGVTPDALPRGTHTPVPAYTGAVPTLSLTEPGHLLWHQYTHPHLYDERDLQRSATLAAFWRGSLEDIAPEVVVMIDQAVEAYTDSVGMYGWACPSCHHAVFTRDLGDDCPVCR